MSKQAKFQRCFEEAQLSAENALMAMMTLSTLSSSERKQGFKTPLEKRMWEAWCALQEDKDEDELLESKEASAQSDEEEIDLTLTMGKLISLISVPFCALFSLQCL